MSGTSEGQFFYIPTFHIFFYCIRFNKTSNEAREQNKVFVYVNSVAEHGKV